MKLLGWNVPEGIGTGTVGPALTRVRDSLNHGTGAWTGLTTHQRGRWRDVVRHNRHDLKGMRRVLKRAASRRTSMIGHAEQCWLAGYGWMPRRGLGANCLRGDSIEGRRPLPEDRLWQLRVYTLRPVDQLSHREIDLEGRQEVRVIPCQPLFFHEKEDHFTRCHLSRNIQVWV